VWRGGKAGSEGISVFPLDIPGHAQRLLAACDTSLPRICSVPRELKQRQLVSVHFQVGSRDLKQSASVNVDSLFAKVLTSVPVCVSV